MTRLLWTSCGTPVSGLWDGLGKLQHADMWKLRMDWAEHLSRRGTSILFVPVSSLIDCKTNAGQTANDEISPIQMTRDLFDNYCARGANILVRNAEMPVQCQLTDIPSVRRNASPNQSRDPVRR